jgi:hypothetical protein
MKIPKAFQRMVIFLNSDAMPEPVNEVQWLENVRRSFDSESLKEIAQFLDLILGQSTKDEVLQDIWQSCYPAYIMSDSDLRVFLTFVRSQL